MISAALEAEILRLYFAEHWKVGTIASQLHLHHSTVRRVVAQHATPATMPVLRPSIADPYVDFIVTTLTRYPRLRASRLYHMVKDRGYPGRPDHFRAIVARYRPRQPAEAFLRLRTLPGEQAQVDWGHFGTLTIGRATRPLMGFVMVLSWSRQIFLRFYLRADLANFLRGHVDAFDFFQGVPRTLLYDNLKSAVLERVDQAIRFNPTLLELAAHYRFLPRPVAVARGNEKGRCERAIRYIRDNFIAARRWNDLADLNAQALARCTGPAGDRRVPDEPGRTVRDAFEVERTSLLTRPENPFPTEERVEVHAGKTPYVRFDKNDYSIPHDHVRRTLTVFATLDAVRIVDGLDTIATHPRSFDQRAQIEDPAHVEALVAAKRGAREHRGMDRLHHAVPRSKELFHAVAERGGNLGSTTQSLIRLLDAHGARALNVAITEALEADVPHLGAVRQILDRRRHEQGLPPPVSLTLPDDPRVRNLVVRPHSLDAYQSLQETDHAPDA